MNTLPQKQFKRMKREVEEETALGVGYFEGILEHIPKSKKKIWKDSIEKVVIKRKLLFIFL